MLLGPDIYKLLLFVPTHLAPHYSIEYRKHFTKIHVTVVGLFGATEHLCLNMAFYMLMGLHPLSNGFALTVLFEALGYKVTL